MDCIYSKCWSSTSFSRKIITKEFKSSAKSTSTKVKANMGNKESQVRTASSIRRCRGKRFTTQDRTTGSDNSSVVLETQRETQVNEMIAGKKPTHTQESIKQSTFPEPSKDMMTRWSNRHASYQTYSSQYMVSQRRMLFLADVDPTLRFEAFEKICFQRQLAPTTAEAYWTTWLGVQKALGIPPSDADQRVTKLLKARAVAYPVQFPNPAMTTDIERLIETFHRALPSLTAIAVTAFSNGQRISDMIQIAVADLDVTENFLMITIRRGKTMTVSKPYTLWMRRNRYPTETLIEVAASATKCGRLFLFSEFNSEEERSKVLHTIRDMITSVNDLLELRSFRRGGLQLMAQNGFSLDTILNFSRHSDKAMLMRYLNWGQHSTHRRQEMIEVNDVITTKLNISIDDPSPMNPTSKKWIE